MTRTYQCVLALAVISVASLDFCIVALLDFPENKHRLSAAGSLAQMSGSLLLACGGQAGSSNKNEIIKQNKK